MDEGCFVDEPVEAVVVPGSNYPRAYRPGARVALTLEEGSGRVAVTRAGGAVKLAYLTDPQTKTVASCLRRGYHYTGRVTGTGFGEGGRLLWLELDPPSL